jgi:hypothetical protein
MREASNDEGAGLRNGRCDAGSSLVQRYDDDDDERKMDWQRVWVCRKPTHPPRFLCNRNNNKPPQSHYVCKPAAGGWETGRAETQ